MELYYYLSRTMLIERLLGVAVYAGLLVLMYLIVRSAKNYKTLHRTLNVYVFFLCVMAFFYIPPETADLYRWRQTFDIYRWANQSFLEFFNSNLIGSATPVANLYMYFCNLTGIDGVLPAFCALVFFGNVFYILKDLYRRHGVSSRSIAVALLFMMASGGFLEVISGVRCFVALSVLARCFYDEIYNKKPILRNIAWEVAAALTHSLALVVLTIRVLFVLLQKKKRNIDKLMSLLCVVVIAIMVAWLGEGYLRSALNKGIGYLSGDVIYSYVWEWLIGILMVIQFAMVISKMRKISRSTSEQYELQNWMKFNSLLMITEIVFFFEYNIFHRMVMLSTLTMMPLVALASQENRNRGWRQLLVLISVLVLFLACARGNLCGYKFFLLVG